jgi:hypothetical protein
MDFFRPARTFPNYCRILLIVSGLMLTSVVGCDHSNNGKNGAVTAAIKKTDIDFPGMQLRPGADKGSFKAVGRIRNKSEKFTVREIKLRFTMEDVLATGASTTAAATVVVLHYTVPPLESRELQENVVFGRMPAPRGRHEWNYSVMDVVAQ